MECWTAGETGRCVGQWRHLIHLPGGGSVKLHIYCTLVSALTTVAAEIKHMHGSCH